MDWRREFTPEEEQRVVNAGLESLAIWEKIFEFRGGISFRGRVYDVNREEQHDS